MRILVLCTLVATTIFTADSADAGRRRRCCNSNNYSYNQYGRTGYNQYQYGQPAYNQCGPTGACQAWNGQATYGVATTVQAACSPAQPTTYNAGYPPSIDGATPMAPPVPRDVNTPAGTTNGNVQSPPAPEPIDNEPAPSPN